MMDMFYGCDRLKTLDLAGFDMSQLETSDSLSLHVGWQDKAIEK